MVQGKTVAPKSRTDSTPITTCRFGPLRGTMVASKRLPYIYVQNWKCGCSTVKSTLWHAEHARGLANSPDYPHRQDGPFVHDPKRWEHCEREFVFTFVRNPFVRVLSAYLNQIVTHRNPEHSGRFAAQHGLGDGALSFRDFLELIAGNPHDGMDPHWRPQYCSVVPSLVPYDFVGAVENLNHDLSLVLARIFGSTLTISDFAPHRTDATGKARAYYGPAEVDLVRRIYAEDFASLGYDTDPARLERLREPSPAGAEPSPAGAGTISAWGRSFRLAEERRFADAIDVLRPLRRELSGPNIDDLLRRCYLGTLAGSERALTATTHATSLGEAAGDRKGDDITTIVALLGNGSTDPDTWKLYGQALERCGRLEDGLAAQLRALTMRDPSEQRDRRLRRLGWRLAMTRARRGRRGDALATLAALPASGGQGRVRGRVGFLRRSLLRLVGTAAALTGTILKRQQQQVEAADARP